MKDLHDARRELSKWLNEEQTKPIDRVALATVLGAIATQPIDLHDAIMNLPCDAGMLNLDHHAAYKMGHRDARHAAAELVLSADSLYQESNRIAFSAGFVEGEKSAIAAPVQEPVNLLPVIHWLEAGRDPKDAAKELRLYHAKQVTASAPQARELSDVSQDEAIELAQAMEQLRAKKIAEDVASLAIGGKNSSMPTPFQAGYQLACDEILERLNTEVWAMCLTPPGRAVLAARGAR